MKKMFIFVALALLMFATSCADVAQVKFPNPNEHIYGFWGGTWHGMIMMPSFIGSLIWDDVAVYAVHNNGAWYDFGFVGGFFITIRILGALFRLIFNR
jgi:hypothetical protein